MLSNAPPYLYESIDGYSVVTLHSSLNDVQWADIEKIGSSLLAQIAPIKTPIVLVDLGNLNYMGSAMVALVVRVWKAVNERQGRMVVANHNEMVLEVLRLAGLVKVWTIVPTREDGLRVLGAGPRHSRSDGAGSGSGVLSAIAMTAAIAAVVGAAAPLVAPGKLSADVAQLLTLGGGAAATVLGLIAIVRSSGLRRGVGVLAVILAVAAVGVRTMNKSAPAVDREDKTPEATSAPANAPQETPSSPTKETIPADAPEQTTSTGAPTTATAPAEALPGSSAPSATAAPSSVTAPGVGNAAPAFEQPAEAEVPESAAPGAASN